ncbi:MAG TPA: hypothetical protein VLV16_01320 [Gemmatimonadales bacterium]|nr:hypothetical protein [Gemmatimonadales bacterium]
MRARMLALVATALAIAACNDASSPTALGSTDGSTVVAPQAHFNGPSQSDPKPTPVPPCHEDKSKDAHRYIYRHGGYGYYWDYYRDRHHRLHRVLRRERLPRQECPPPDGGGGPTTGSVDGTVKNNGAGPSSFPLFLLTPDGATVVATVMTGTDGTGVFNFTGVTPGSYLLCETDPFTEEWGMLGQTRPNSGPACPTGYGQFGFSVTVTAGGASSGLAFSNMQLD